MAKMNIDIKESRDKIKQLIQDFEALRKKIKRMSTDTKNSFSEMGKNLTNIEYLAAKTEKAFDEYERKLKNITKSQRNYKTQTANLKKVISGLNKEIDSLNSRITKNINKTKNWKDNLKKVGKIALDLLAVFGLYRGIQMFSNSIKQTFKLLTTLDSLSYTLSVVSKEIKIAIDNERFLSRVTKQYGTDLVTTTNRYIKFYTAARQSNVTAEETKMIFEAMTKAAGVLSLRTDELRGIYLALEQMMSKGKITTEELRRQLGERLPGAMGIMAKSMGVSMAKLDEMMKKGEVLSSEVLPKFAKEVEKAYGIENVTKIDTLVAANIRFKNAWVKVIDKFRQGTSISKSLTKTFDFLSRNLESIAKKLWLLAKTFIIYKTGALLGSAASYVYGKAVRFIAKETARAVLTTDKFKFSIRALFTELTGGTWVIISFAITALIELLQRASKSTAELAKELNDATIQFHQINSKVLEVNENLKQLSYRYEYLRDKTNKTNEEQDEFKSIILNIAKAMPETVSQVDGYGKAIEINTELLRENIKEQKELIFLQSSEKMDELTKKYKELSIRQKEFNSERKLFNIGFREYTIKNGELFVATTTGVWKKATDSQRKAFLELKESTTVQLHQTKRSIELLEDLMSEYTGIYNARQIQQMNDKKHQEYLAKMERERIERQKKLKSKEHNIENLTKWIQALKEEQKLYVDREDRLIQDEKHKGKSFKKRLDEIAKEIKMYEEEIRVIKRLEKTKSGGRVHNEKFKFDSSEIDLEIDARKHLRDLNKDISKDENRAIEDRIDGLKQYYKEAKMIYMLIAEKKIESYKIDIKNAKANKSYTEEERLNRIKVLNKKIQLEEKKIKTAILKIDDDFEKERIELIDKYAKKEARKISEKQKYIYDLEVSRIENEYKAKEKNGRLTVRQESEKNRELLNAKITYNKASLAEEIKFIKNIIQLYNIKGELKEEFLRKIAALEAKLFNVDDGEITETDRQKKLLESYAEILDYTRDFTTELGDLFQSFTDRRIEQIDAEIAKETERFDYLIALNEKDATTKENLERQKNDRLKKLEKERLKETQKAAKLQKVMAIADIGVKLARSLMTIKLTALEKELMFPGTGAGTRYVAKQMPLAIAMAALQTASVLAQPIPKYAKGGFIKKDEVAMINDAGRIEYVERDGRILTTNTKNAIVELKENDIVHKDYDSLLRNSMIASALLNGKDVSEKEFVKMTDTIEKAIYKGFKKSKINNQINLYDSRNEYGDLISRWT